MANQRDPDFLSWDEDIDLDFLFDSYTEDESHQDGSKVSSTINKNVYVCPLCEREYMSISGFRGHVSKKHNTDLKAHQHRKGGSDTDTTTLTDHVKPVFEGAFERSMVNIMTNPMYNIFGESNEAKLAKLCQKDLQLKDIIQTFTQDIFKNNSAASSSDREEIFKRFHNLRTNEDVLMKFVGVIDIIVSRKYSREDINNFIQIFLLDLMGELFKGLVENCEKKSDRKSEALSENDNTILYYISGYIIRALEKKYNKIKNQVNRDRKTEKVRSLRSDHQPTKSFTDKYTRLLEIKDRGGLRKPSDEFFFLIREFENVVRMNVNMDNLHAGMLKKDKLKEVILDAYMVKYYSNKLFSDEESGDEKEEYVEDCINIFLTMRGYAIAKLLNKKEVLSSKTNKPLHSLGDKTNKSSNSLRDSLKSLKKK